MKKKKLITFLINITLLTKIILFLKKNYLLSNYYWKLS